MLTFDRKQKENFVKILINLGTASFVGLVVGRFVSPEKVSLLDLVWGILFSTVCFVIVLLIEREEA